MTAGPAIVWFRHDLRLADNPALTAAARRGGPVLPVYIWAPEEEGDWPPGTAARWWLHRSLTRLGEALAAQGSRLVIRRGPSLEALQSLVAETGATAVYWNRRYEPAIIPRDTQIKSTLKAAGVEAASFNSHLLIEPWEVRDPNGKPFHAHAPFWREALKRMTIPEPEPAPELRPAPPVASLPLAELNLGPAPDRAAGLSAAWQPGETAAWAELRRFLDEGLARYDKDRDLLDAPGRDRLTPHLRFGEVGPRQVWHAVEDWFAAQRKPWLRPARERFLHDLGWREFAYHVLFHHPTSPTEPLRPAFARFRWRDAPAELRAWQEGRTGYPLVDAAMRQLRTTGWLPDRARLVVASFLTKDLLIPWQAGARWFRESLVDADLAESTVLWQWSAGCGLSTEQFVRIFNPATQSKKFDPDAAYLKRWLPELVNLPAEHVHEPAKAPAGVRAAAGVELGVTYPNPMVDHAAARRRAIGRCTDF